MSGINANNIMTHYELNHMLRNNNSNKSLNVCIYDVLCAYNILFIFASQKLTRITINASQLRRC